MKILLFDVDGTIVESGQKISIRIKKVLEKIKENGEYELGIVGGGRYEKIVEQLDGLEIPHIFSESGCVYHRRSRKIYVKSIRHHALYSKINIIIKKALEYLSQVDYEITGHFIDLRSGIIYISLIGMNATLVERNKFIEIDRENGYRKKLLEILRYKAKELEIEDQLEILEGGSVGIGIYPREWDKIQVLDLITSDEFTEIHYFGDKYEIGGNDYRLIHDSRVIGHKINYVEDCLEYLESIA